MNIRVVIFIFVLVIGFCRNVMAGNENGGGGSSVVCRGQNNNILSAETLDLYEGKNVYGLIIDERQGSVQEIIESIKQKLKDTMEQPEIHLFPLISRVQSIFRLTGEGVILKPVDDVSEIGFPADCKIEQLAHYVDDDLLVVQREIWGALSNTQKASLIIHEAIYRHERYYGATNSRRARKIVSRVFSDSEFENVMSRLPQNLKFCSAYLGDKMSYRFFYYPVNGDMTQLQFLNFKGFTVYSRKTAVIPIFHYWENDESSQELCGSDKYCNYTSGTTYSKFEGNDSVILGRELDIEEGGAVKFYMLDNNGRNYLDCQI
ncbi:MAG: hypothetical protein KDD50_01780 [Bdellovibrionales bacterium]|nr:hypothetical protein [Bdellovibrionales bacterium]